MVRRGLSIVLAAAVLLLLAAGAASAHGFSSVVYVDATSPERGHVRTVLGLEYDLLVVSAADAENDDPLFRQGTAGFDDGGAKEQAAAPDAHAATILAYVSKRFGVLACTPTREGGVKIGERDGVPYAFLTLDYRCPRSGDAHELRSRLFPDAEGYVRGTKTIGPCDLTLQPGRPTLDERHPAFSTHQSRLALPVCRSRSYVTIVFVP